VLARREGQSEVDLARAQRPHQAVDVAGLELAGQGRMQFAESLHRAWRDRQREARQAADVQASLGPALQVLGEAAHLAHALLDLLGLDEQDCRLGGRPQAALDALKQAEAERRFGMAQHLAGRRLRDAEQLGGLADRAGLHHRMEDLDVAQAHGPEPNGSLAGF